MPTPEFRWEEVPPVGAPILVVGAITDRLPLGPETAGKRYRGAMRYAPGPWVYTGMSAPVRAVRVGSAASVLRAVTQAATGTRTTGPSRVGSAASVLRAVTQAATGTRTVVTQLAADNYNRTEAPLATSSSGHTWTHPHAPTRAHGANGATAYHTGPTGETASAINVGTADATVKATVTPAVSGNADAGLCGRLVDSNTYLLAGISIRSGVNRASLFLHDGTYTQLGADYNLPGDFQRGTPYVLELVMAGTSVTFKVGGVTAVAVTLTGPQTTALTGGVSHGLRSNNEAGGSTWEDFAVLA